MYKKCEEILNKLQSEGKIKISNYQFPQPQELKLKLKDLLEDEVDEKYYLSDKQLNYVLDMKDVALKSGRNINDRIVNPQIAKTISCRGAVDQRADVTNFTIDECDEELKVKDIKEMSLLIKNNTKKGYLSAYDGDGVNISSRMKYQRGNVQKESIQTITTSGGNDRGVVVKSVYSDLEKQLFTEDGNIKRYIDSDIVDEFKDGQMATTSFPNGYGHGPRTHDERICLNCIDKPSVKHNLRIRKLTPKECWRLMGFDDVDFEKASKVNSNSQLYKQAGNSICVPVLENILKELLK